MSDIKDEILNNNEQIEELIPIEQTCIDCGEKFVISPGEQKYIDRKGYSFPKRCMKCRINKKKEEEFVCVDCNKKFSLNMQSIAFYKSKDLPLPKRCPECIKLKKRYDEELAKTK